VVAQALALAAALGDGALFAESAGLLIKNARIWTGSSKRPFADSMRVAGDVIHSVGDSSGTALRVIDAGGRLVIPGLVDSHVRLAAGGLSLGSVQLRTAKSRGEFAERIRRHAAQVPEGKWITGGGWNPDNWGGELPTREWIDAAAPRHPVWLHSVDGRMAVANSLALKLAGVTARTLALDGGTIRKDARGEPTGVLTDAAMEYVQTAVPAPSGQEFSKAIDAASAYLNALGVTSVHDMGLDGNELESGGAATLRIYTAAPLALAKSLRIRIENDGQGDRWIRRGLLLGSLDGSPAAHTAAFEEPYLDAPGHRGSLLMTPESLHDQMISAQLQGLNIAIRASGDRAVGLLLDVIARIGKVTGPTGTRFRVEHAQHLRPSDVGRFQAMGVIASMQPAALAEDGRWLEKRIGEQRARYAFAFRSLLDSGAVVAFGSGWPARDANPFEGIHAAVTRQPAGGGRPGGWIPAQKISVEEALRAYTFGGAYAAFEESYKGTLEPGKLADFVMLDQDLFRIDPGRIRDTKVLMTVVGGKVVYERN